MAAGSAHWSSRFVFLMASVGFAVGLGNIWRFPYITGENGGAAFVLVYLACAFGIGAPILIAEMLIGRRGQGSPTTAVARVAAENGSSRHWQWVGGMGLLAAFTIEIVYAVVVGWVLWYLFKAINTGFLGFDGAVADAEFAAVLDNSVGMLAWTLVGLAITGMIVYAGVKDGIERAVIILMPLMFLLLAVLAAYNYFMPPSGAQANGFSQAITWLFTPDFSKIGFSTVLAAIGQAFFSLGVAMAGMMVYGAYMPKSIPLTRSVLLIVTVDTGVALLAGLVVFPVVFQNGLDPAAGAGLIFQTLPVGFAEMPGGHAFSILFFLMLSVAGITSIMSLKFLPQSAQSLITLYDSIERTLRTAIEPTTSKALWCLGIENRSSTQEFTASTSPTMDVIPATDNIRKNRMLNAWPPGISANPTGSVWKIRPAPAAGSSPF